MRKSLGAAVICHAIVFGFSVSANFSAQALPAPTADGIELNLGLVKWDTEIEVTPAMSKDEVVATLVELARPLHAAKSKAAMCETLATAAHVHDLPVGFFVRLINQESGFNPEVVSPAGAQGVAQFMPKVAEEWGLKNPFDPHAALVASARFLRSLYMQFGNWGLAAAAYNGGMGRVQKWVDKRGKLPDETRHYVKTITGMPAEQWIGGKSRNAKFSIPARSPCQEIAHLADSPAEIVPLPPSRTHIVAAKTPVEAGPPSKTGNVVIARTKGGSKVAMVKVKPGSKVAAVKGKIAEPKPIVASAGFAAALPKGKRGKATAARVAEKSPAKSQAKSKTATKGKGRVQVADASKSRK